MAPASTRGLTRAVSRVEALHTVRRTPPGRYEGSRRSRPAGRTPTKGTGVRRLRAALTFTAIATCAALLPVAANAADTGLASTAHTAGRVVASGDTWQHAWPGVYFEGRFRGTGVGIVLDDADRRLRHLDRRRRPHDARDTGPRHAPGQGPVGRRAHGPRREAQRGARGRPARSAASSPRRRQRDPVRAREARPAARVRRRLLHGRLRQHVHEPRLHRRAGHPDHERGPVVRCGDRPGASVPTTRSTRSRVAGWCATTRAASRAPATARTTTAPCRSARTRGTRRPTGSRTPSSSASGSTTSRRPSTATRRGPPRPRCARRGSPRTTGSSTRSGRSTGPTPYIVVSATYVHDRHRPGGPGAAGGPGGEGRRRQPRAGTGTTATRVSTTAAATGTRRSPTTR